MEALEFITKLKEDQILIPPNIQSALETSKDKEIRVILLIEGRSIHDDDRIVQQTAQEQFLKGYADSDSIYDNSF